MKPCHYGQMNYIYKSQLKQLKQQNDHYLKEKTHHCTVTSLSGGHFIVTLITEYACTHHQLNIINSINHTEKTII